MRASAGTRPRWCAGGSRRHRRRRSPAPRDRSRRRRARRCRPGSRRWSRTPAGPPRTASPRLCSLHGHHDCAPWRRQARSPVFPPCSPGGYSDATALIGHFLTFGRDDISRRDTNMRRHFFRLSGLLLAAAALPMLLVGPAGAAQKLAPATVNGSGSTLQLAFDQQVLLVDFHKANPTVTVNYSGVGSGAGRTAFIDKSVDFAGSDTPFPAADASK